MVYQVTRISLSSLLPEGIILKRPIKLLRYLLEIILVNSKIQVLPKQGHSEFAFLTDSKLSTVFISIQLFVVETIILIFVKLTFTSIDTSVVV